MTLPNRYFPFLLHFLKSYKRAFFLIICASILVGFYSSINSYLTKALIDIVSVTEPDHLYSAVLTVASLFIINDLLNHGCHRLLGVVNLKWSALFVIDIERSMFIYVQKHSFRFFQHSFSGSIERNISKLASHSNDIIFGLFFQFLRTAIQIFTALICMYYIHPYFSLLLFLWLIVFLGIDYIFSKKIVLLSDNVAKSESEVAGVMVDSITNASNVRLFANHTFEVTYMYRFWNRMREAFQARLRFIVVLQTFSGLSFTLLIAGMLFTLLHLRVHHLVSVGDFAFILGLSVMISENIWWVTEEFHRFSGLLGECKQSLNNLIVPHDITDEPNAKILTSVKGDITFDNITFHYKKTTPLFHNFSVKINAGEKVGLVGFSGSGKTTFANLIVRLFDVSSGNIHIDQHNIKEISQDSLHQLIGFIPQDPILFHRSLRENIRYGNVNASEEEIIEAAKKAHAHEFIINTQEGYDSLVGERGVKLSGGQRQRISIARAILKNAPLLILDEATSALDSVTEEHIQESLAELMHGKTVIVIAHRLSTLLGLDRILVFDQGKIVEDGTHETLLSRNNLYATLWNSQVNGFLPSEKTVAEEI